MKNIKIILILFTFNLFLSGCMSLAWIGYEKPSEASYVNIENAPIKIGIQNLTKNPEYERAIRQATREVFRVLHSKEFKKRVEERDFLASCKIMNGSKDLMKGKDVYATLNQGYVNFSIHPRKPWKAIAQAQKSLTNHAKNRVAINPKQIEKWSSLDKKVQSELINTIAHEITHTVSYQFLDKGHGKNGCLNSDLVSYSIGNLVAELWLKNY